MTSPVSTWMRLKTHPILVPELPVPALPQTKQTKRFSFFNFLKSKRSWIYDPSYTQYVGQYINDNCKRCINKSLQNTFKKQTNKSSSI